MRGEEGVEVAVFTPDQLPPLAICGDAEAEPAVFFGNLHAEGAELPQAVDHVLGVLAGVIDRRRIDLLPQERLQLVVEAGEFGPVCTAQRKGMDDVELEVAEEEIAEEPAPFPLLLARLLRELA